MVADPNNCLPASSGGLDHCHARLGVSPTDIYVVLVVLSDLTDEFRVL